MFLKTDGKLGKVYGSKFGGERIVEIAVAWKTIVNQKKVFRKRFWEKVWGGDSKIIGSPVDDQSYIMDSYQSLQNNFWSSKT